MDQLSKEQQYKKGKKLFNTVFGVFFVVFILTASFGIGFGLGKKKGTVEETELFIDQATVANKKNTGSNVIDFSLFWDVWDLLKDKYVDAESLDARQLFYGAINGMLRATGDPYTVFLDPENNEKFNEDISGSFEGIGAEIGIKGRVLTIIAPLKNSPAENSGLRAGDKILKIDDESTADMSINESVDRIRGQKGTEVRLTIFRNGDDETQEITVTRDVINVKSVELEFKDNIAYIEVNRFGRDTIKEFSSVAKKTVSQKSKGIILDLRNNPGGFLNVSVDLASKMIPKGKVVVIEEDSDEKQKKVSAKGGDILSQIETIVLINKGSASASEIVAGALRDNRDNVTVVGEQSFGKGSVQELIPLPKNSAVKITVAKWLTPSGDQINNEGISPDIEVELTNEDYDNDRDPQLDRALEILKEKIQ
ncbi:MAG TPA: S41 family peptidase [Candidatus Moranbacteria bacterium]|nr:S41 family peptidase [Candidatus Moranbacteria bacterium]